MLKSEKRNYAKTFTLELYACEFCELCVQVCPTDAIVMMKSFDMPTADRREMLLDKDRLHVIGLEYEQSWATGNRLRDMQTPPKAPAPAHAAPKPAAATTEPLKAGGALVEWHLYPGTTHAWDRRELHNFTKTDYRGSRVTYLYSKEATEDSGRRIVDFMERNLGK